MPPLVQKAPMGPKQRHRVSAAMLPSFVYSVLDTSLWQDLLSPGTHRAWKMCEPMK